MSTFCKTFKAYIQSIIKNHAHAQTEIKSWDQRGSQLRIELQREEQVEVEENRLQNEYKQLISRNKSLRQWKEKMNTDLRGVREQQQRVEQLIQGSTGNGGTANSSNLLSGTSGR